MRNDAVMVMAVFVSFTKDELRLLVCIATSSRGWTDEQHKFMKKLEKELFDDE